MAPYSRYRKKVPKAVRTYVRSAISRSLESKRAFVNASNVNLYGEINSEFATLVYLLLVREQLRVLGSAIQLH